MQNSRDRRAFSIKNSYKIVINRAIKCAFTKKSTDKYLEKVVMLKALSAL